VRVTPGLRQTSRDARRFRSRAIRVVRVVHVVWLQTWLQKGRNGSRDCVSNGLDLDVLGALGGTRTPNLLIRSANRGVASAARTSQVVANIEVIGRFREDRVYAMTRLGTRWDGIVGSRVGFCWRAHNDMEEVCLVTVRGHRRGPPGRTLIGWGRSPQPRHAPRTAGLSRIIVCPDATGSFTGHGCVRSGS